mgnify:FL=1
MRIRKAEIKDSKCIAKVNIDVWRTTYRGIMPDEDLDNLSCHDREKFCKELLEKKENDAFIYVAEDEIKGVIGFISGGRERERNDDSSCEIYAIYVSKEFQRKGIGRSLFKKALEEFIGLNLKSLKIWVLNENPYKRFYEKLGGKQIESKKIKGLDIVAYGWDDIKNINIQIG